MGLLICVTSGFALALVAPWISRFAGRWGGWALALLPAAITAWLASHIPALASGGPSVRTDIAWAPGLGIHFSLHLDALSLFFALLISGIGVFIFAYGGSYLAGHRHLGRMQAYLLMFMASMLGLVLADNILSLFVFWELTSLASYLLIGFDHQREQARKAALQALLVTGGGGLALLAGLLLMGMAAPGEAPVYDLTAILSSPEAIGAIREHAWFTPIVILVLAGAFTKSAQFPFHFWLPSAMEAPTPVSAYLHSSTMVKAGIYLMARFNPILGETPLWTGALIGAGAVTMVTSAVLALRETRFKRVLAYSTVSALGTITMAIGLGSSEAIFAGMAFLLTHALYKGALFMIAGAVDHETGVSDTERLGGLARRMPALALAGSLAALSMAGLPPLLGFISKEMLLKVVLESGWLLLAATVVMSALTVTLAIITGIKAFLLPASDSDGPPPEAGHGPSPALVLGPVVLAALSLGTAIVPEMSIGPLLRGAASAVAGQPVEGKLALWHGITPELGLSAAAVVAGVIIYALRAAARRSLGVVGVLARVGPAQMYQWAVSGLNAVAEGQTRLLQHGRLRFYVLVVIATGVILTGCTLVLKDAMPLGVGLGEVRFYEAGLSALVAIGAIFAAVARRRLAAIAALGLVGFSIALIFVVFGAPDLAMTQLAVETLAIMLFLLVFYHLPDFRTLSSAAARARDMVISIVAGAVMTVLVLLTVEFESEPVLADYYSRSAVPEAHGRNVVNVILVDFRALDTLGEIAVLAIAAIGVFALLKMRLEKQR